MRLSPAIAASPSLLDHPAVSEAFGRRLDPTSRAPIGVAFSGGGDSLALLLAATDWAARAGRPVAVFHVDHRLQAASDGWADFARDICLRLGAAFHKLDWTGGKPAAGLPAAARAARHRLIAEAARRAGCTAILVGHTADDVRESGLIREATPGHGRLAEWSPSPVWPEGRGLFHFRPLLAMSREGLRQYLTSEGWRWIEDPANDNPIYARARARSLLSSTVKRGRGTARRVVEGADWAQLWGGRPLHHAAHGPPPPFHGGGIPATILCAAGTSRPPRAASIGAIVDKLAAGRPFTATLAGARIEGAAGRATVCRDAGAYARFGAPVIDLAENVASVWDGRFEVSTAEPGWSVRPLKGLSRRLSHAERAALKDVPPAARPALPLALNSDGRAVCPILAADAPVMALWLGAARLDAALGRVQTEADAAKAPHGERGPGVLSWGLDDL